LLTGRHVSAIFYPSSGPISNQIPGIGAHFIYLKSGSLLGLKMAKK